MKLTCSILGFENVYNLNGGILNWHYDVIKEIPEKRKHINALLQQIEEPKGGTSRMIYKRIKSDGLTRIEGSYSIWLEGCTTSNSGLTVARMSRYSMYGMRTSGKKGI